eukprot:UN12705
MCETGYFITICSDDADKKLGVASILSMGWKRLKRKSWSGMGGKQIYDVCSLRHDQDTSNLTYLLQMFKENKLKVIIDKSVNGYNMNNCYQMFEKSRTHPSHG